MAPRGLKKLVSESAPGKLVRGKFTGYRAVDGDGRPTGPMLKGITKLLAAKLYSKGELDESAVRSTEFRGGSWGGEGGGLRRGRAVDTQVSRLAAAGVQKRESASSYKMTRLAFSALTAGGMEPLAGQRVVVDSAKGIGTACDVVCWRERDNALVVVELKTGFAGNRTLPATLGSSACRMRAPCASATDCVLFRHMAQLATTRFLLASERELVRALKARFGIDSIEGALLYVNGRDTSLYPLDGWWKRRSKAIVATLCGA